MRAFFRSSLVLDCRGTQQCMEQSLMEESPKVWGRDWGGSSIRSRCRYRTRAMKLLTFSCTILQFHASCRDEADSMFVKKDSAPLPGTHLHTQSPNNLFASVSAHWIGPSMATRARLRSGVKSISSTIDVVFISTRSGHADAVAGSGRQYGSRIRLLPVPYPVP
jgi:hypothetical protein